MKLKNKIALITGASKGIGAAVAISLAKEGVSVIINYNSDKAASKKVVSICNRYSKGNITVQADISDEAQVKEMFDAISKTFKKIDILINNAGIFDEGDSPRNIKAINNVYQTNFLGQVRVIDMALNMMKRGKIVNVSSIHGRIGHGRPSAIAYSAMKAALDSYTKNLAKDLAPNILVNAVAPGKTLTPMWGDLSETSKRSLAKTQLIDRWITPEEIADGILFILKNDAVCGETLVIDGGMGLKVFG